MTELSISINSNWVCKVDASNISKIEFGNLKTLVFSRWDNVEIGSEGILLKWYQLKRVFPAILKWAKLKNVEIKFTEEVSTLVKKFASDRSDYRKTFNNRIEQIDLSILYDSGFYRKLTEKQVEDFRRLLTISHGANFSVPGAGKTTTLLSIHTYLKSLDLSTKLLVVSPINAFISWEMEIKEIFKGGYTMSRLDKPMIEGDSNIIDSDVLICNYEKLRNNIHGLRRLFSQEKVHMVLDESHRIKSGFDNQSYAQIVELGDFAIRRDIMSGTPMPQAFSDITSQVDFIWPYEEIAKNNLIGYEELNKEIKGLFVRTTKKDLDIDPVKLIYTDVEMGPLQYELFRLLRSESARRFAKLEKNHIDAFRYMGKSVVRLMQASSNPILLTSNTEIYDEVEGIDSNSDIWSTLEDYSKYEKPAKFNTVAERVKELTNAGNKVLIWSIFVKNILLLKQMLEIYNPAIIYGGVPSSDEEIEESREGQIRKFHDDDSCKVMIANPQACGEGISLHRVCHHAIYLERNYNAAHYIQSMDRIHRYGLPPGTVTTIEILSARNSLDTEVDKSLKRKVLQMGKVLDDEFLRQIAYDPHDIDLDISGIDQEDYKDLTDFLR